MHKNTVQRSTYAQIKGPRYTKFIQDHGDDAVFLHHLWNMRYGHMRTCPKCALHTRFYRITGRTQYQCGRCHYNITPLKDTIFYRSHIPISVWFYAIYLCVINGKNINAQKLKYMLGVQYRTALRMWHRIKRLTTEEVTVYMSWVSSS